MSGIVGYTYTKTNITLKFHNGDVYRYDLSKALSKSDLETMIVLAKRNNGLNSFLNSKPAIRKYGYVDETLRNISFTNYG